MHDSAAAAALTPTPTDSPGRKKCLADFDTLWEALDYAGDGETGFNFYSARGQLKSTLPFRDLRDQAQSLARRLIGMGLRPGDRVALLAETSPEFLKLFFACQYANLIPVPLPLPTAFGRRDAYIEQIKGQIASSAARAVLGPEQFLPYVADAATGLSLLLIGSIAAVIAVPEGSASLRPGKTSDLSYIQYSSGSTRYPKGVMITHANLMANCRGMSHHGVGMGVGYRGMSWLPFFHDMGLVGFVLCGLTSQTSVDFLATEDFARRPLTWLKVLADNRSTISYAPSFGYELCARRVSTMAEGALDLDLSSWRVAGIGGEMIKPGVIRAFADAFRPYGFSDKAFCASYGLAECVLAVSFAQVGSGLTVDTIDKDALEDHRAVATEDDRNARTFVSCGRVLPGHSVEIRDDNGNVLGERAVGRVFISGPSVMHGYLNEPDTTAEVLSDGWLDSGDLGYFMRGELVIVGRAKDMMIINGRNVWPQDIEWAVEHVDGLRSGDSAAILLEGPNAEERPTVLVQCRYNAIGDRERITTAVKSCVQEAVGFSCDIILVPPRCLPKTTSGKLARARAKAMFLRGEIAPLGADQVVRAETES